MNDSSTSSQLSSAGDRPPSERRSGTWPPIEPEVRPRLHDRCTPPTPYSRSRLLLLRPVLHQVDGLRAPEPGDVDGSISLDDPIESHVPDIGRGFAGRSITDVAALAVNHNVAELAAYTGDPDARIMFDRDERVIGLQRNDERDTMRQFITTIELGEGGSTEWPGDIANDAAAIDVVDSTASPG